MLPVVSSSVHITAFPCDATKMKRKLHLSMTSGKKIETGVKGAKRMGD